MAVAVDSTGLSDATSNSATTQDYTGLTVGSGANRLLVGMLNLAWTGTAPTGITMTWDPAGTNQAMTQVMTLDNTLDVTKLRTEIWKLLAPTAGNKTLRASWTNVADVVLSGIEFSGVDQTTPIVVADNQSSTASGSPVSLTIPSTSNDATLATCSTTGSTSVNQTQIYVETAPTLLSGSGMYALGGTSNVHTFTNAGAGDNAAVGVHVQAVQGGGGAAATPTGVNPCLGLLETRGLASGKRAWTSRQSPRRLVGKNIPS